MIVAIDRLVDGNLIYDVIRLPTIRIALKLLSLIQPSERIELGPFHEAFPISDPITGQLAVAQRYLSQFPEPSILGAWGQ